MKNLNGYHKVAYEGETVLAKNRQTIVFIGKYIAMELYDKVIKNDTNKLKELELKN